MIWKLHSPQRFYADPAVSLAISFIIFGSAIPMSMLVDMLFFVTPYHPQLWNLADFSSRLPPCILIWRRWRMISCRCVIPSTSTSAQFRYSWAHLGSWSNLNAWLACLASVSIVRRFSSVVDKSFTFIQSDPGLSSRLRSTRDNPRTMGEDRAESATLFRSVRYQPRNDIPRIVPRQR